MRNLITVCVVAVLLCGSVQADLTWSEIVFDAMVEGAASYDSGGANVVASGSAFYETITGSYLGTQLIGGDGINLEVAGNFAMYGVVTHGCLQCSGLCHEQSDRNSCV